MIFTTPADHAATLRDVHPSHKQIHIKPISQPLYIIAAVSNPQRYWSRYKHYHAFERHMADSGVKLFTVELALRDRHFEVTTHADATHIQLRSESELWHKENLVNIGVSRLPADWHYAGYVDADFLMTRPDWANEALHQLQHYQFVQLFSTYSDLMPDHSSTASMPGFVNVVKNGLENPTVKGYDKGGLWGAPGGAWAWRREAFDTVGGMLDTCVLGSADWHMAASLFGRKNTHRELRVGSPAYIRSLNEWDARAQGIKQSVGYVENHAIHRWHGNKSKRGYVSRAQILSNYAYDPYNDVRKDWQGVLGWTGSKPKLEEAVRQYFLSRDEDEGVTI